MPGFIPRGRRVAANGAALVIVLFFIILLSVVTIAFLARSLTAAKVTASSTGETKSRILAASASDIIIGDFKQEIIAGSAPNAGTANFPIYVPNYNTNMIPFQSGVPTSGVLIPNMISRSVNPNTTGGTAPYKPYPGSYSATLKPLNRAANETASPLMNSSTNVCLSGRYISPAQWNAHYLIPRDWTKPTLPAGSTNIDSSPALSFLAPDWVVVTRAGANSVSWSTGSGGLNDPTITNTNCAIGRYAFAVYNEGGTLDMNAAGYPGTTAAAAATANSPATPASTGLSTNQFSPKGSLALADLTQLSVGTSPQVNLTQGQINNFVAWRNYASSTLSSSLNGTYGNFNYTAPTATAWLTNFVSANTNGFMQIVSPPAFQSTPPTDQALISRQQLISVTQSLGISSDFLQYMGTFSRGLEQPSSMPDPNRPKIFALATGQANTPAPPLYTQADSYMGNNDAQGGDTSTSTSINPSFLSIRAQSAFTRLNSTIYPPAVAAVSGEPLVKTKFPLRRLLWITYAGPSANRNLTSPTATGADADIYALENTYNVSAGELQLGTAANISAAFGLSWDSTNRKWLYNVHCWNGTTVNNATGSIPTLSQVANNGARDPDFAELLKASIIAGSLAKGGPNLHNSQYNYQYTIDTSLDTHVMQIMANLIDQQDADSYPTVIAFNNNTVYGVEDLPYFYRYHLLSVVKTLPTTAAGAISRNTSQPFTAVAADTTKGTLSGVSVSKAVNYLTGTTQGATWTLSNTTPATIQGLAKTTLTNPGEVDLLYIPDLWNPHDTNNATSTGNVLRPAKFRIYAVTDDPVAGTPIWQVGAISQIRGSNGNTNIANGPLTSSLTSVIPTTDSTNVYYNWPIAATTALNQANSTMTFSDNSGKLFREPTLMWNYNPSGTTGPSGLSLTTTGTSVGSVVDVNTTQTYWGIFAGKAPISFEATFVSTNTGSGVVDSSPTGQINGTWVFQGNTVTTLTDPVANSYPQISFFLQYLDALGNWITYDVKYPDLHGLVAPNIIADPTDDYPNYGNPLLDNQLSDQASDFDPRTARWGVGTSSGLGEASNGTAGGSTASSNYLLEPANTSFSSLTALATTNFTVLETTRPRADKGNVVSYSNPGMTSDPGKSLPMRLFSGVGFSASNGQGASPSEFDGLLSQNNPALFFNSKGTPLTPNQQVYFEDTDGVARRAMGAYADTTMTDSNTANSLAVASAVRIGLPLATANTFAANNGVGVPISQSQSRPLVLNRPFRNVGEMSYAFSGTPWKNIDFFTPESGDSALLDTFCITTPPSTGLVAGKVDLNTRQIPVLQALVANAYIDELSNAIASPPTYALPPLTGAEAKNVATTLETITSDTTHAWRGPLQNVAGLVGRFVATPGTTTDTDLYTYSPPALSSGATLSSVAYAGLSSALDCSSFNGNPNHAFANASTPLIQRFRESAIRPLADAGQVRVWNLLIDVVAQTGRYPKSATGFDQFIVDGQTHLWVHVAIDRLTGQVLDKQVEAVNQ